MYPRKPTIEVNGHKTVKEDKTKPVMKEHTYNPRNSGAGRRIKSTKSFSVK